MNTDILKLLENDARLTPEQIAIMLGCDVDEVKLTPQRDSGFDRVAEKIYNYPEVQSVQLMAGGYDLSVLIEGKTMKEVALFVSQKLATIDGVIATATHFVLHKYKDKGILYDTTEVDERGNI